MTDVQALVALQRRAAEKLQGAADGPDLLAIARDLAATVRDVVADDELWSTLVKGSSSSVNEGQLAQLVLLDWTTLLKQAGHGENTPLAGELANAVLAAVESTDPESWLEVRELLTRLADDLDADAATPARLDDKNWWRALRDKVGYVVSALRRVSRGALLAEALSEVFGTAGAAGVIALITGAPFGPAAPIVAAAIAGLGKATVNELRRYAADRQAEQLGHRLDTLFSDVALQRGGASKRVASLRLIDDWASDAIGRGEVMPPYLEPVIELLGWGAHVGAQLVSARPFVAAHIGRSGVEDIDRIISYLADLRVGIDALAKALVSGIANTVAEAASVARALMTKVLERLGRFSDLLAQYGIGDAAGRPPPE